MPDSIPSQIPEEEISQGETLQSENVEDTATQNHEGTNTLSELERKKEISSLDKDFRRLYFTIDRVSTIINRDDYAELADRVSRNIRQITNDILNAERVNALKTDFVDILKKLKQALPEARSNLEKKIRIVDESLEQIAFDEENIYQVKK